ncbi:MAG: universal stress protein [Pseudomonadota bacterium]
MWVILVPVANRPESAAALEVTFGLAETLQGVVLGTHIRTHRGDKAALPSASLADTGADWETDDAEANTALTGAADLFRAKAEAAGFELHKHAVKHQRCAVWQERVGTPEYVMPIIGPACDMAVVSRPASRQSKRARAFMLEAIMRTQRPVLILPASGQAPPLDHIAIGWNRSPEASRALHAALPVLKTAKAVTFITAGNEHDLGPSTKEMTQYLKWHGIDAQHHHQSGPDGTVCLIKAYSDIGADVLLLGAYSQSRWRQRLFGGTSESLLIEGDMPLLMMHS